LSRDQILLCSDIQRKENVGWSDEGYAITDVTHGYILFDILGIGADDLMRQNTSYNFDAVQKFNTESAFLRYADIKLAASKRPLGWRLHCERSQAAYLWHRLLSQLTKHAQAITTNKDQT
jgi:sarcosine oxidase gamma subunit